MKRFHVHVSVDDLARSVRFYSALFDAEPAVLKSDYAKWMLDDPRINFAISERGAAPGVDHLGLQVDDAGELAAMQQRFEAADPAVRSVPGTACCYAESDKHWARDPSGIAWEAYHTLAAIPTYGASARKPDGSLEQQAIAGASGCCTAGSGCC